MTNTKKRHPENRDGQSKAVREAASSCQAPCHNIPPPSFSPVKYESPGWSLEPLAQAALQERGAGCASLCLFSPKKGKSLP